MEALRTQASPPFLRFSLYLQRDGAALPTDAPRGCSPGPSSGTSRLLGQSLTQSLGFRTGLVGPQSCILPISDTRPHSPRQRLESLTISAFCAPALVVVVAGGLSATLQAEPQGQGTQQQE